MNHRSLRPALAVSGLLFLAGCSKSATPDQAPEPESLVPPPVTIMTFNVLNLFDNADAPRKDDKAYLPIEAKQDAAHIAACNEIEVETWRDECLYLDWNDAVLDHKLETLAATIMQVNDGRGPDVIAFQEIENAAILDRLSLEYLRGSGYGPAILVEGNDSRGIDVAFLSRLPLVGSPTLHPVSLDAFPDRKGDTRGILEATFRLPDGAYLTGFSVHFPAPYHPTGMREVAYRHLESLRNRAPANHNVFAAGDFNTTSREDAEKAMLDRFVRPQWIVAHDFCEGCPGTNYYARDDVWSFLDMVLYASRRDGEPGWQLDTDSVRLATDYPAQLNPDGTPARYDAVSGTGVSDHLPLVITIEPPRD